MPLHLQHHKSYHPYNKDNIEKVRRDEEEAQKLEQDREEYRLATQSEARLEQLRQQRKRKTDPQQHNRLQAAEKEIRGHVGALSDYDERKKRDLGFPPDNDTSTAHINFWSQEESMPDRAKKARPESSGAEWSTQTSRDKSRGEKNEKEKWEERMTMFLGRPSKELQPWYQDSELKSGIERKKSHEQLLEEA